jgi:hypothetical protein
MDYGKDKDKRKGKDMRKGKDKVGKHKGKGGNGKKGKPAAAPPGPSAMAASSISSAMAAAGWLPLPLPLPSPPGASAMQDKGKGKCRYAGGASSSSGQPECPAPEQVNPEEEAEESPVLEDCWPQDCAACGTLLEKKEVTFVDNEGDFYCNNPSCARALAFNILFSPDLNLFGLDALYHSLSAFYNSDSVSFQVLQAAYEAAMDRLKKNI